MIERVYWLDTVEPPVREAHELPSSVDIAIVGGGFTGLSAARALAKRGAIVAVFEAHHAGWGASSRNGGMVLTGLKLPAPALVAKFGVDRARRLFDAAMRSIDFVERLVHEESIDCDFRRCGHAEVASKPSHFERMRKEAETLETTFAHLVELVEKKNIDTVVASDAYHGALIDPSSGGVNPARLAYGLAAAASRRGAVIHEGTSVTSIERTSHSGSSGFTVVTSRGSTHAQNVVLASGAYTGSEAHEIRRRVVSIGSYIIATEPLGEGRLQSLIPGGRMVFDSNNFLQYCRATPDGRMLFGGRAAFVPANERTIRESAEILRRGLVRIFPQLDDVRIEYAWGGSIDFTFDLLPHAGASDGLFYALGYAGHGVAMATYLGERVAAAILGDIKIEDGLETGPLPQPPPGVAGDASWLLPIAGAWYRLLDWAS